MQQGYKKFITTVSDASDVEWDCVVVGAGMGGGATAYACVEKGKKTLLIDAGFLVDSKLNTNSITTEIEEPTERKRNGLWPSKIRAVVDGSSSDIWAPMGSGIGGSTLLYAAALQRLEREDFAEQALPSGEKISWPFSFDSIVSYYEQAETLLKVRGTRDPRIEKESCLLAPPKMSDADEEYFKFFEKIGLNPYRLHVGIAYKEGCGECAGELCPKECKSDASNSFIVPALHTNRLSLLPGENVVGLESRNGVVEAVVFESGTKVIGKTFFLAAGALNTPKLLLSSTTENDQPIASGNKYVGRNLMFHSGHHIAYWPPKKSSRSGPNKTIALRDFYKFNDKKMGEFQSTGLTAGYGNVLYAARFIVSQNRLLRRIPLLKKAMVFPAYLLSKLLGKASIFATICEDFPYFENRVELDSSTPSGFRIVYNVHDELSDRTYEMLNLVRSRMKPLRSIPMNFKMHLNYGHPCGTCRASTDAKNGVLDKDCRVFGTENLYVTDASFMPTSGGTNPSLTIAANALRVVDFIYQEAK